MTWLKMQMSPGPADRPAAFSTRLSVPGSAMFCCSWLSQGGGDAAAASAWLWTGGVGCHMLQPRQDVFIYALGMGGAGWYLT